MTDSMKLNLEDLIKLARDKSQKSRSALVTAINDMYSSGNQILTDQDRALMTNIMRQLIHDVEVSVRRSLSEQLANQPDAPQDLVLILANDEIEVAYPILAKSEVLKDEELIEIIKYRAMEHQTAIAMRQTVNEPVSDALVDTGNEKVVSRLLSNQGAKISTDTMDGLVELSRTVPSYQTPLVHRRDLSSQMAKKLYWGVSVALRKHIIDNFEINPSDLDQTLEKSVEDALGEKADSLGSAVSHTEPMRSMDPNEIEGLLELVRRGNILEFVQKFSTLCGLRLGLMRRLLFEEGGEGLAVVCKAIDIEKHMFLSIFLKFRAGRVGDKGVASDELAEAISFYDRIDRVSAKTLIRRWQRDPDYLNALRLIEQN